MSRRALIATTMLRYAAMGKTVEDNLARAEAVLVRAAASRPDIVCLPETFNLMNVSYDRAADVAEPVPGPTTDRMAAVARKHGMYLVCSLVERAGGDAFTAAVLIDRRGRIDGTYRKLHPTLHEFDMGIRPGDRPRVFETDFGRVGILICFDIAYPECWREIRALGAEIVFWPSAYPGGLLLQGRACDNEIYVVSSTRRNYAEILDISGHPLSRTGNAPGGRGEVLADIACADLDPGKRLFYTMAPNSTRIDAIRSRYGRRVTLTVLDVEGAFTLESNDASLPVADIIGEFGLEPQAEYNRRSEERERRLRG
jgi:beta-ureidopropionase